MIPEQKEEVCLESRVGKIFKNIYTGTGTALFVGLAGLLVYAVGIKMPREREVQHRETAQFYRDLAVAVAQSQKREKIESAKQFEEYLINGRTDFSNTNLSGLDLSGIDFKRYYELCGSLNFSNADMRGINLSGAYLVGANLSGAKLGPLK